MEKHVDGDVHTPGAERMRLDTGMGPGASHQTGWTGLAADLTIGRHDRDKESE